MESQRNAEWDKKVDDRDDGVLPPQRGLMKKRRREGAEEAAKSRGVFDKAWPAPPPRCTGVPAPPRHRR